MPAAVPPALPCPPELWPVFSRLLDEAFELPAAARNGWLAGIDPAYAALTPWLTRVLGADARARTVDYLDRPRLPADDDAEDGAEDGDRQFVAGQRIGPYRLEALAGQGGMGEVWRARRVDGAPAREVALKLPLAWTTIGVQARRLRRESEIVAALNHPNIAQLYEIGIDAGGQPWLALEWVDGQRIDDWCRTRMLDIASRLTLFGQVFDAVRHAHSRLIVHRDLKPANILVSASGQVKLLDFGIAKLLDAEDAGELTRLAGRALTPDYAAPEQLRGDAVSVASDVYALGVVLFELLTGRRPPRAASGEAGHAEPPQASTWLDEPQALALGSSSPREARRQLHGDLDAILAWALNPDAVARYGSVEAFADDVQRHLRLEPIRARRTSGVERSLRWLRRNRLPAMLGAAALAATAAGVTGIVWQAGRTQAAARMAQTESARVGVTRNFLLNLLIANDPRIEANRDRSRIPAGELLQLAFDRLPAELAGDPTSRIELLGLGASIHRYWSQPEAAQALVAEAGHVAETAFGPQHPVAIRALIEAASAADDHDDAATALRLLAEADGRLHAAGLDDDELRARWWSTRYYALPEDQASRDSRIAALQSAIAIASRRSADTGLHVWSRLNLAIEYRHADRCAEARDEARRVIEISPGLRSVDRRAYNPGRGWSLLAKSLECLGDFDAAEAAWAEAGQTQPAATPYAPDTAFEARALHAMMVHDRGDWRRADTLIAGLADAAQASRAPTAAILAIRQIEALMLASDGRVAEAQALIEILAPQLDAEPAARYPEWPRIVATVAEQLGRGDEAGVVLKAAVASAPSAEAPAYESLLLHEHYARWLIGHGQRAAAAPLLRALIDDRRSVNRAPAALALADLARVALADAEPAQALSASRSAVDTLAATRSLYDQRFGIYIWRVHAEALAAHGDVVAAADWRARADALELRCNPPAAADRSPTRTQRR